MHWRSVTPPALRDPAGGTTALTFLDARHAWLATDVPVPTIWRTADGGRSWRRARIAVCRTACGPVVGLDFLDGHRGWAVVDDEAPELAITSDGGATWRRVGPLPTLGTVDFVDARHGWMTSNDRAAAIFRTSDGGTTWSYVLPADAHGAAIAAPVFFGAHTIVVAAVNEVAPDTGVTIDRTDDDGVSWRATATPVPTDTGTESVSDLRFVATSPSQWIVLSGQQLFLTTDAGTHWKLRRPTRTHLRDVAFASSTEGWLLADVPSCASWFTACTDRYLYRTVDAGRAWTLRSPRTGVTANRSP